MDTNTYVHRKKMWPPAQHCALSEFTLKLLAHSFKLNLLIAVLIIYTTQRLSLFNARFAYKIPISLHVQSCTWAACNVCVCTNVNITQISTSIDICLERGILRSNIHVSRNHYYFSSQVSSE